MMTNNAAWTLTTWHPVFLAQGGGQPAASEAPAQPSAAPPINVVGVPGAGPGAASAPGAAQTGTVSAPGGTTGIPAQPASPLGGTGFMVLMGGMLVLMIGMSVLAGRKDKKRRQELMSSMKKGDRVLMAGGMIGTITELSDDELVLRVEEGRIRFSRSSVQQILKEGRPARSDNGVESTARAEKVAS